MLRSTTGQSVGPRDTDSAMTCGGAVVLVVVGSGFSTSPLASGSSGAACPQPARTTNRRTGMSHGRRAMSVDSPQPVARPPPGPPLTEVLRGIPGQSGRDGLLGGHDGAAVGADG